jgi:hypothetical protein
VTSSGLAAGCGRLGCALPIIIAIGSYLDVSRRLSKGDENFALLVPPCLKSYLSPLNPFRIPSI